MPELPFDDEKFLSDVKRVYENNNKVIVAVSEGLRYADGTYVADSGVRDSFGHAQLGGVAYKLADMAKNALGTKVRAIEFSLLQRCAAHWASKADVEEAFMAGQTAVLKAVEGLTDYCIGFEREAGEEYKCVPKLIKLSDIANTERKLPREWINEEGNFVTKEFVDYALPLIQGESSPPIENGLPRFAKLKKFLQLSKRKKAVKNLLSFYLLEILATNLSSKIIASRIKSAIRRVYNSSYSRILSNNDLTVVFFSSISLSAFIEKRIIEPSFK